MEPVLGIGLSLFLEPSLSYKAGLVSLRGVERVRSSGRNAPALHLNELSTDRLRGVPQPVSPHKPPPNSAVEDLFLQCSVLQ